jgi:phosphoglycolate phosphatase-like HAD superfamily hydrolase
MFIRYAVFDLDHTLITSSGMDDAWRAAIAEVELADRFDVSWLGAQGRPVIESARLAYGCDHTDPRAVALVARFWQLFGDGDPTPIDGAAEVLANLHDAGIQLFLSTGSHPPLVEKVLDRCRWAHYFDRIYASTNEFSKGALHFERLYQDIKVSREEFAPHAITIGDGPFDMQFGKAEGIAYRIGFSPLTHDREDRTEALVAAGATHVIRDLREVVRILDDIESRNA